MASTSSQSVTSFVQPVTLSTLARGLADALSQSVRFDLESTGQDILLATRAMAEAKNWSPVAVSQESWKKLFALRSQLVREGDSLISAVSAINPRALWMSENAMIVQVTRGLTPLKSFLTMEEDCGLLIPISVSKGDAQVSLWDPRRSPTASPLDLALSSRNAHIAGGTGIMRVGSYDPLVFVIFCLACGGP